MKLTKKLFGAIAVAILFIGMPAPVQAFDDAGNNPLPVEQRAYQRYERFSPTPEDGNRVFYTYGISATPGFVNPVPYLMNRTKRTLCPSLASSCYSESDQIEALGYLPECKTATQSPCIKAVWGKLGSSDWIPAEVIGAVDLSPKADQLAEARKSLAEWQANMEVMADNEVVSWAGNSVIPAGASGALKVRIPGVPNSAGKETYVVKSVYQFSARGSQGSYQDFFANIIPYVDGNLDYADPSVGHLVGEKSNPDILYVSQSGATGDATKFAWSEYGKLGYAASFSNGTSFKLELQLPSSMGGWFHGRMVDPLLKLSVQNRTTNLLAVEANPALVPVTGTWIPAIQNDKFSALAQVPKDIESVLLEQEKAGRFNVFGPIWEPRENAMQDFTRHLPMLGEKAKGQASVWSVASITNIQGAPACLNKPNTFQGLVTTDSMVYQAGIPKFENGYLNYQVGGLHHNWKGEVIQGSYNLIMRSDSARCLYGFSKAPVSATISVLDADGENINATTVMGEKDGWLKLTAQGFTFSQKTIKVKMTQAGAKAKTTITCVKGKLSKKVTATAPKCPAGYKKK